MPHAKVPITNDTWRRRGVTKQQARAEHRCSAPESPPGRHVGPHADEPGLHAGPTGKRSSCSESRRPGCQSYARWRLEYMLGLEYVELTSLRIGHYHMVRYAILHVFTDHGRSGRGETLDRLGNSGPLHLPRFTAATARLHVQVDSVLHDLGSGTLRNEIDERTPPGSSI